MQIRMIVPRSCRRDDLHGLLSSLGVRRVHSVRRRLQEGRGGDSPWDLCVTGGECHDRGKVLPSSVDFPRGQIVARGRADEMSTKVEAFRDRLAGRHLGGRIRLPFCVLPCTQAL